MNSSQLSPSVFKFLNALKDNNDRPWFNDNKPWYQEEHAKVISFAEELIRLMNQHDEIEQTTGKETLFRIYRDTRFSKDKTPYKSHFSGSFSRSTKRRRGGYYFHIEPGNTLVAGGFWAPNSADLKRIRQEIAANDQPLREIISSPLFKTTFGELEGDAVKTAPRGFSKEHPAIDLIRKKQFIVTRHFTDKEVLSPAFAAQVDQCFQAMRPYFDYMTDVLTTDANGVPLFDD